MSYDEGDDETNLKTSTLNVETLLGLVAQTAEDPSTDVTTVIAPAQELREALANADADADRAAPQPPCDSGIIEKARALQDTPPLPAAAPARRRTPRVRVHEQPRRSMRLRLFLLGLLTLVVASQPWWWNIGDLRSHVAVRADAPPAR